ncbi:MAG: 4Fe-4S binding protein, partial [Chloroflexota bacterium]
LQRCQVKAIDEAEGVAVVDANRCIGCGLCVTGCSAGAVALRRRPDWETIHPPETFAEWEHQRLHHRQQASAEL